MVECASAPGDRWYEELAQLRAENARLRAELGAGGARFRDLVEAMPHLVWTCDAEGSCDYLGPQWGAYTGRSDPSQLGLGWLEQVHTQDRERVHAEWLRCSKARIPLDVDFRIKRADGTYRWFKTRAVPSFDARGNLQRWLGTNTDIEDLRVTEAELRALRDTLEQTVATRTEELGILSERLVRATRAARVGIWDWDVASNTSIWDDNMYQLYGLDRATSPSAGEIWFGALHPEDKPRIVDAVELALRSGKQLDARFRIVIPTGPIRHMHVIASVERDAEGRPLRMLGVNWDVTTEELALQQLRETEQRWNFALQGTGDGVWDWNLETDEAFLSERSRELLGHPRTGVITRADRARAVHPDDFERVRAGMQAHLRGETQCFSEEYRVRRPEGDFVWVHGLGRVMARDSRGTPLRMVGTYKDITERRLAQAALEQRETLLRQFIAHTPAAIAVLDRDMRYMQASQRWLTDYKLVGQDIIGKSHYEVFPDLPERWRDVHQRVLSGGVDSCDDDPFVRSDGSVEWLQWEARPWHEADGSIGGVIFFTQVITTRKQLELKLAERNEQLSRSNAELEQFAYAASHDLQEPLRAVTGCTQLLAHRYESALDADAGLLVRHIVDGAARMKTLIEGLLQLSRVNGRASRTATGATWAARQALLNLDASIVACNGRVSLEPLPDVVADATQLVQLFQNLIGNAIKYQNGRTPEVSITSQPVAGGHQFSIRDNGIGIAHEYFERIFGVFQRLHTREEYPGTGIGLSICRKIVERHGGRIWLESAPGCGSTFHFTIMN